MFRRPRRPFRPIPGRIPRQAVHQAMIRKAFQMQTSDNPEGLAKIFSDLAEQTEKDGHMRQAANFHAQAAHRWLDAANVEKAQTQANLAMDLFQQLGMENRLQEFQNRYDAHMQHPGKPIQEQTKEEPVVRTKQSKSLPTNCPKCGAPVRSNEVEWIDEHSAECGYCGSVIKTIIPE